MGHFKQSFSLAVGGAFIGNELPITPEEADDWEQPTLFVDWFRIYQQPFSLLSPAQVGRRKLSSVCLLNLI